MVVVCLAYSMKVQTLLVGRNPTERHYVLHPHENQTILLGNLEKKINNNN